MNRTLVIALVLGLSGTVFATAPAEPPSVAVGNGEGLSLLTTVGTNAPAEFLPGQAIPLEMQLVNTSKAHAYLVVKPGDGSESGWREPHVYYTAERSGADGGWTRMEPTQILRCGLYDDKWQKDVVTLKPGESLLLKDWLLPPSSAFEFQQVGRYRIRAHYAYRGGQGGKGNGAQTAEDVGGMQGIAPFEIVSSPVEVAVKRPLNVTLKVRRNLIADQPARLSDLLDIAVGNDSDKPINTAHPTLSAEGRLTLQMRAELGWGPTLDKQDNPHAAKMDIQPGQSMPLLGKGAFANGVDGTWTYPRAETVKLRAGYTPSTWKDVGTVWSDWVEVKVEPAKAPHAEAAPQDTMMPPCVEDAQHAGEAEIDQWIKQLANAGRSARHKAAACLGEAGPAADKAIAALIAALKEESRRPKDDREIAATTEEGYAGCLVRVLAGLGKTAVPPLIDVLKNEADVRQYVLDVLGRIGPDAEAAVPAVVALGKDSDAEVRASAVGTLGRIGRWSPQAIPAMINALRDDSQPVRASAVRAMGEVGPGAKEAVPALIRAWKEETDDSVRKGVVDALGLIGPDARDATAMLADILRHEEPIVRWGAARSLGRIGPAAAAATNALREADDDKVEYVRKQASEALERISLKPSNPGKGR